MKPKEIILITCLSLWGIEELPADLDSEYKLETKLGKGSFAKVKLAKNKVTGKEVAIKIIDKKKLINLNLADEAKIMKMLNHPNILKLIKFIETKKSIYLVIEYASGGDLLKKLQEKGKIDETEARRIFRQMFEAVEYLHHKKVAHRDLKPENFLLDSKGNIKLADFGLAIEFEIDENFDLNCGSLEYMAPEAKDKKNKYDRPKSDVWSLGVILYVLVTGLQPFNKYGKYFDPPGLSYECAILIETLLEKEPENRPTLRDIMLHGPNEWLNKDFKCLEPYTEHEPESKPHSKPPRE